MTVPSCLLHCLLISLKRLSRRASEVRRSLASGNAIHPTPDAVCCLRNPFDPRSCQSVRRSLVHFSCASRYPPSTHLPRSAFIHQGADATTLPRVTLSAFCFPTVYARFLGYHQWASPVGHAPSSPHWAPGLPERFLSLRDSTSSASISSVCHRRLNEEYERSQASADSHIRTVA